MDHSAKKWLIRAGSLFIMFGFFVPSVMVSCTALGMTQSQSFSMGQLTSSANQPLLYLVLIGAIIALVAAFLPPRDAQQRLFFMLGEILGLGLGVLTVVFTIISLSGQLQKGGMGVSLSGGSVVLIIGYSLGSFGVLMEILQLAKPALPQYNASLQGYMPDSPPLANAPPHPVSGALLDVDEQDGHHMYSSVARLELVRGNAPALAQIAGTDFLIGRSSRSHLVLSDSQISGAHARIRFAQGNWFIQDQNSSNGTLVNGRKIQAQRLNNGDQIKMGGITYIFRI